MTGRPIHGASSAFAPWAGAPCYRGFMFDQRRFVARTRWLRPFTRWAARFAMKAPRWLPARVRHAPLRLSSLVLRFYHYLQR